jgi:hypothetical protein
MKTWPGLNRKMSRKKGIVIFPPYAVHLCPLKVGMLKDVTKQFSITVVQ